MFLIAINVLLATLNVYTNYTFINIQFKYIPINYYNHVFINVHEITAIIMQLLTQIHPRKNKVNIHRSKVLERIINFTLLCRISQCALILASLFRNLNKPTIICLTAIAATRSVMNFLHKVLSVGV